MIAGTGTAVVFYAGSTNPNVAPFRVTANGGLYASNATISGNISVTGGTFDNITVNNGTFNNMTSNSGTIGGMSINGNGFAYGGYQIIDRTGSLRCGGR